MTLTNEEEIRLICLREALALAQMSGTVDGIVAVANRFADFLINGVPEQAKVEAEPVAARPGQQWSEEDDAAVRRMTADRIPARRIADHLGKTASAVRQRRSRLGITTASPGQLRSIAAMHAALAAKRAAA